MHVGEIGDGVPVGIQENLFASCGDHIAYFWATEEDFTHGVKFLEIGLRARDAAVIFGHRDANSKVIEVLRSAGFDVEELIAERRLIVLTGRPTAEAMLDEIAAAFRSLLAENVDRVRLLGNIGWRHPGWPDDEEILRFESSVTAAVAAIPCIVVCMYDVRALSPDLIVRGGLGAHPFTVSRAAFGSMSP